MTNTSRKARKANGNVAQRTVFPPARELFPILRRRLLSSRPVIEPAKRTPEGDLITRAVYGEPTFRNVIDPDTGAHI